LVDTRYRFAVIGLRASGVVVMTGPFLLPLRGGRASAAVLMGVSGVELWMGLTGCLSSIFGAAWCDRTGETTGLGHHHFRWELQHRVVSSISGRPIRGLQMVMAIFPLTLPASMCRIASGTPSRG
jgi:hypothetical protein